MSKKIKCKACFEKKDASCFYFDLESKSSWNRCQTCITENKKVIIKKYPKRQQTKENNYKYMIAKHMEKTYGITIDIYNSMVEKQNGKCVICNGNEVYKSKGKVHNLSVDHCHKTGKIRELLCRACNQVLGIFKENIERFENAIIYLKKHNLY